jgi:magnesium-transporting ATPase (P-type)
MLPPWYNVLWHLLCIAMARSGRAYEIGISCSSSKRKIRKTQERRLCSILPTRMLVALLCIAFLLSVCFCDLLFECLYRFGIEISSWMMHEYHEDEEQYLAMLNYNFFVF